MKNPFHRLNKVTKNKQSRWFMIAYMVPALFLLVMVFIWFHNSIDKMIEGTTERSLTQNAQALAAVFNAKLEDQLIMLESQARYFDDVDMTRYNDMKNTILATKGIGGFKTIGVSNNAGATINYNGESSGNILLMDYFKDAMSGMNGISKTIHQDEEGDSVLLVAVPIRHQDKIIGVIFGSFDENLLSTLIDSSNFHTDGANMLLAADGTILAKTAGTSLIPEDVENFYQVIEAENIPQNEEQKVFNYNNGKSNTKVVLTPVGVHEWYFGTVIPQTVITEQSAKISTYMLIVVFAVAIAFLLFMMLIVQLMRDNDVMSKENERFQMVTVQSQDIIFDYDYDKKSISLDGYLDNLISTKQKNFSLKEFMDLFMDMVHKEDRRIIDELLNSRHSDVSTIKGEFRIKCTDDKYYWFKMKSTIVRTNEGLPLQMVGSVINVDEQMNKERTLIEKAETDSLTGILNKGAFQAKVQNELDSATGNDLFALYIIDLDNFKAVNDTLGHAMGDQVLMDVAKKLCIVFSEKDIVGRIGGDEFCAFLKLSSDGRKMGMNIIESKGRAICNAMKETYRVRDDAVDVSSSVGVALFPQAGRDYVSLYKNADTALYEVKTGGKNQFKIFDN